MEKAMKKFLVVTNMEQTKRLMQEALIQVGKHGLEAEVLFVESASPWKEEWRIQLSQCEVVLFLWMGTGLNTKFLSESSAFLQKNHIRHLYLMNRAPGESLDAVFTEEEKEVVKKYYSYGGLENWRNLWLWLFSKFGGIISEFELPQQLAWDGIYHPKAKRIFEDIRSYRKEFCSPLRATIAMVFYRNDWVWNQMEFADKVVGEIEKQGFNALCFFSTSSPDAETGCPGLRGAIRKYFYDNGQLVPDVFINTIKFSLTTVKACSLEDLLKLDLPILQAYTLYRSYQDWYDNFDGMSAMEVSYSVSLPEFDGIIHAVPVTTTEVDEEANQRAQVIPERLTMLIKKAGKWAQLRRKANQDKKIAIIFHNYPPTNSNIGSASAIDSIESIRLVLEGMKEEGYFVERIPQDRKSFIEELTANATNDRQYMTEKQVKNAYGKLTREEYQEFYRNLPPKVQEKLAEDWGAAPGDVFYYDDFLLIPGTINGNIFITVQPPRGFGEDPAKIYHSPDCAPTHHYLGFYAWLRDVWKADAMIHVGTHGSLEWLPGKGTALSNECYPDIATGDMPNIYPYWIVDVGEGIQAKRRSAACLISYLSAPMSVSGTYEELAELEKGLEEYCHFRQDPDANLDEIKALIREKALSANLEDDVPEKETESFDEYVGNMHAYLTDLKNMQMTTGLHVLGQPPAGEHFVEYLFALTKLENGEIPSLAKTVSKMFGYDYYDLMDNSSKMLPDGSKTYGMLLDEVREKSIEIIKVVMDHQFIEKDIYSIFSLPWTEKLQGNLREDILRTTKYICQKLAPSLLKTTQEITNLLAALDSRYIEPSAAGAPTSGGGDILPTGRNFYGVDPQTLPTPVAWKIGSGMAEDVIQKFIAEEGRYPESVGLLLWSTYNLRSHGQCMAEFMALIGVRPVWQRGSMKVVDIEVIPLEELKRPRVDVTGRISSLFRDTLPGAVCWLDKAIAMVAELDEGFEENFVRKHIVEESQRLESEGIEKSMAWRQASYRIFGDPPGVHGAGVGTVLGARNWDTIDDLAKVYVKWGGHVYGEGEKGQYRPELFSNRMAKIDVTVSNIDNRESNLLNSDDYNSYRGGMIAAVRSIKGSMPRNYCSDSSDRQRVVIRTLEEEVKRLFRGEAVNPKYINGMKEFGYKGAGDLANYVDNSFQWDATSAVMEDWMYEKFAEKYAMDATMQEWFQEVNPWALHRILSVLLEAEKRGLWNAKAKTKEELQALYLSIEGEIEERSDRNN